MSLLILFMFDEDTERKFRRITNECTINVLVFSAF